MSKTDPTANVLKALDKLKGLDLDDKVNAINAIQKHLLEVSPFSKEPVGAVIWVKQDDVIANDYNPNSVAPPEMKLLQKSIQEDGYTQPVVTWVNGDKYEVVDGFHRNRVAKEVSEVNERLQGYLPVVVVNDESTGRGNRIASTVRHNRARGKHSIDGMAEIVLELKRRNWSDKKIGADLGMDPDEVLRLSQITGLAEMFADRDFSKAWEIESVNEDDTLEDAEDEANIPSAH
jgi:ParB-like chromosome segregation protein Spo0J